MKSEISALKTDMRNCWKAVKNHGVTILLFTVLGFLLASLCTLRPIPDVYSASASICSTVSSMDNTKNIRMISVYGDLMSSSKVTGSILSMLGGDSPGLEELMKMLTVKASDTQSILTITAAHSNPAVAVKIANTVTQVLAQEANEIYSFAGVRLLDQAGSAVVSVDGQRIKLLIRFSGAVIVGFLSAVYFIVMVLVSGKVIGVDDCCLDGELEVIGVIPFSAGKPASDGTGT